MNNELFYIGEIGNKFHVPGKTWVKWSLLARAVFNKTYKFLKENAEVTNHPKQENIKKEHWLTIAWNSAWIAASAVDGLVPDEVI